MPRKKFWVYKHDKEGDLVADLGDFDTLEEAIDAAVDQGLGEDGYDKTVRVVDSESSNSVWLAGPIVKNNEDD